MHKGGEARIRYRQKREVFPAASGGILPKLKTSATSSHGSAPIGPPKMIEPFNASLNRHRSPPAVGHASTGQSVIWLKQDEPTTDIDSPSGVSTHNLEANWCIVTDNPFIEGPNRKKLLGFLQDSKAIISSKRRLSVGERGKNAICRLGSKSSLGKNLGQSWA
ncbi:hypothetical protein EDB85DRAFT_1892996 [Lactarius pseudohatsudake]|nr:hypothetical protein EDB85DRAFT_1892996 [Lactarius pseudohatsudake]